MKIDDIELNSRWYVQLAPRATLMELEVVEKTELTVVLRDTRSYSNFSDTRHRFDEITFVEACYCLLYTSPSPRDS